MTTILRAALVTMVVFVDPRWAAELTYPARHRAGGPRWLAR